ncbi:MAG: ribosome maturation factor RimP [Pseudomonadota bacterium]
MQRAADNITQIIMPAVTALGLEIVRVRLSGKKRLTLQIMIERSDGGMVTVDNCAQCSNEISTLLDVHDPLDCAYALEISSPGIDRPLTRKKDFAAWSGFEAKVDLLIAKGGRKHFRGQLLGIEDDMVIIQNPDNEQELWQLPFGDIGQAKLMMNDKLMTFAQHQLVQDAGDETLTHR